MPSKRHHRPQHQKTDFLSGLSLLRNDPDLLAQALPRARAGDVDAQYALGLIYAEGRGVAADPIEAYLWLSRAVAQGDDAARDLRSMLMNQMSQDAIAQADQLLGAEASR